jgi:hypothetical protein
MLRNNGKRKFEIKMKYEPTSMSDECVFFSWFDFVEDLSL